MRNTKDEGKREREREWASEGKAVEKLSRESKLLVRKEPFIFRFWKVVDVLSTKKKKKKATLKYGHKREYSMKIKIN